ncbi:MAG: hypothetical protein U9O85_00665 [Euryarchaeota archaeon]|nr:hypothetical protein [Euryarchaeota archaeon]
MAIMLVCGNNGSTLEDRGSLKLMQGNNRTDEEVAALKIPYCALTLKEALYLLTNYYEGYFDAGKQSVVLTG